MEEFCTDDDEPDQEDCGTFITFDTNLPYLNEKGDTLLENFCQVPDGIIDNYDYAKEIHNKALPPGECNMYQRPLLAVPREFAEMVSPRDINLARAYIARHSANGIYQRSTYLVPRYIVYGIFLHWFNITEDSNILTYCLHTIRIAPQAIEDAWDYMYQDEGWASCLSSYDTLDFVLEMINCDDQLNSGCSMLWDADNVFSHESLPFTHVEGQTKPRFETLVKGMEMVTVGDLLNGQPVTEETLNMSVVGKAFLLLGDVSDVNRRINPISRCIVISRILFREMKPVTYMKNGEPSPKDIHCSVSRGLREALSDGADNTGTWWTYPDDAKDANRWIVARLRVIYGFEQVAALATLFSSQLKKETHAPLLDFIGNASDPESVRRYRSLCEALLPTCNPFEVATLQALKEQLRDKRGILDLNDYDVNAYMDALADLDAAEDVLNEIAKKIREFPKRPKKGAWPRLSAKLVAAEDEVKSLQTKAALIKNKGNASTSSNEINIEIEGAPPQPPPHPNLDWMQAFDHDSTRSYWIDRHSGNTSWVSPSGFQIAPPPPPDGGHYGLYQRTVADPDSRVSSLLNWAEKNKQPSSNFTSYVLPTKTDTTAFDTVKVSLPQWENHEALPMLENDLTLTIIENEAVPLIEKDLPKLETDAASAAAVSSKPSVSGQKRKGDNHPGER